MIKKQEFITETPFDDQFLEEDFLRSIYTSKIIPDITTKEYFNLKKLNLIINILGHLSVKHPDNETIKLQYEHLTDIANNVNIDLYEIDSFDNDLYFIRDMGYIYNSRKKNHNIKIGRIYPISVSVLFLTRQIRYYLFKDIYTDVDLVNSHPSILLAFAKKHNINCECLEKYVTNRDEVMTELKLKSNNLETNDSIKKKILVFLNSPTTPKTRVSFYMSLHSEILKIRDKIWRIFMSNETPMKEYLKTSKYFEEKTIEQQKVSAQSIYCFTEESFLLMSLYVFLKKKADINSTELSFVPIFDGALIRFVNRSVDNELKDFVNQFNSTIYPFTFKIKDFEPDWDIDLNEDIIKKYEKCDFLCYENMKK
jgi:hypothetical protein